MKKVVLFIGFYERDNENKLTAEKMLKSKFFMKKMDDFVRFCIPDLFTNINKTIDFRLSSMKNLF